MIIEQPGKNHTTTLGNMKYSWDVQLNKKVPVDLALHFGAGQARLDLGSLQLRGVEVDMGVGQLDLDLRGSAQAQLQRRDSWRHRRGYGSRCRRMREFMRRRTAESAASRFAGCSRRTDTGRAPAYDRAENKIRIEIQGGIGQINVIAD